MTTPSLNTAQAASISELLKGSLNDSFPTAEVREKPYTSLCVDVGDIKAFHVAALADPMPDGTRWLVSPTNEIAAFIGGDLTPDVAADVANSLALAARIAGLLNKVNPASDVLAAMLAVV